MMSTPSNREFTPAPASATQSQGDDKSDAGKFTAAGHRCLKAAARTIEFLDFIGGLAGHADYATYIAGRWLAKYPTAVGPERNEAEFPDHLREIEVKDGRLPAAALAAQRPGKAIRKFRSFTQELLEMLLVRLVDNFTTFLSESIRSAIEARPGLIKSRQEVRLEYVLGFGSMDALTRDLIDRKVSDLGYKGLIELEQWLTKNTGLTLFDDEADRDVIREAVETRNCIVHARGVVGLKYEQNVAIPKHARGTLRKLDPDDFFAVYYALTRTVVRFDAQVAEKFSIERQDISRSKDAG